MKELADIRLKVAASGGFLEIWKVAGIGRRELRNAAVLAWLFDPGGTHGRHSSIFSAFLQNLTDLEIDHEYSVCTENYLVDNINRVDISIESNRFLILIEIKIDAVEGPRQIERYAEVAKTKAGARPYRVIYLTREGAPVPSFSSPNILRASWGDVATAIRQTKPPGNKKITFADIVLNQFSLHAEAL